MLNGSPYQVLGVTTSASRREIRAAYASKLRSIASADDPAAFIALREAYERALGLLSARSREPAPYDGAADPSVPPHHTIDVPPAQPAWLTDLQTIDGLIEGSGSRAEIYVPIQACLHRALNHPAMMEIDHSAQMESWLAQRIVSGIPRTNALIAPVIDHFGWDLRLADWDCPVVIHQMMQRRSDNMLYATLLESDTRTAKVFRMLIDPQGRTSSSASWEVQQLIARIQRDHPTLMFEIPDGNVDRWNALSEHQYNAWDRRLGRWLDATWAPVAHFLRRTYLDRVMTGIALVIAIITLVLISFGAPFLLFITFRWIGALCERIGMLFGDGMAD